MNLSLEILNQYVEEGWVVKNDHPSLPLSIYNYSRKTQYEGKWDDVTLQCRGVITDNATGKVLVRPFKKFFNYEELVGNKWKESQLPPMSDYVYIQEKMDGSLGILFYYERELTIKGRSNYYYKNGNSEGIVEGSLDRPTFKPDDEAHKWYDDRSVPRKVGEWIMATRGSFVSEQAIKGLEILKSKYNLDSWLKHYGYLVEILYPENRIVVDYGKKEKVVFLSVVMNESYEWGPFDDSELHWTTSQSIFKMNGIKKEDIVKTEQHFNFSDDLYKSLKEKNENNKEGFVLRFQPGNFRVKIKFEEYVRLHKIITQVSTYDIWEHLKNGKDISELLEKVPDEFDKWVKKTVSTLQYHKYALEEQCGKSHDYFRYGKYNDVEPEPTKKEFAEHVKKYTNPKLHGLMFAIWDGNRNRIDDILWKLIKPEYSKPFWQKDTE
jgi:RNA ligase